jgi:hypothetical protein
MKVAAELVLHEVADEHPVAVLVDGVHDGVGLHYKL